MANAICFHCEDKATVTVDLMYLCKECYQELYKGILPMVTDSKASIGGKVSESSPSGENAVRHLEGE